MQVVSPSGSVEWQTPKSILPDVKLVKKVRKKVSNRDEATHELLLLGHWRTVFDAVREREREREAGLQAGC